MVFLLILVWICTLLFLGFIVCWFWFDLFGFCLIFDITAFELRVLFLYLICLLVLAGWYLFVDGLVSGLFRVVVCCWLG